ncbi:Smr/MutS family protein [uncultured Alsobacter sp.]|uniref:Smr/MutS family protein n=1 Tax=uncultured Alsobacter sp. TaxID=1748258 RepID=UPI0025E25B6F|nr:Smr/MutS family protein [uncultured Alsobacter sp.]
MRRRRTLTGDEQALWSHVTRHVAPLNGRLAEPAVETPPQPVKAEPAPSGKSVAPVAAAPVRPPSPPPAPPLAPIERRLKQRLSRGSQPIDAVIDLHGMRQAEAHDALRHFILRGQAAGHMVVLVVTGKGGSAPQERGGLFEERGVLRRVVPHWLRLPDLRPAVLGFDEAVAHHGGSGALYVRLRRRSRTDAWS